MNMLLLQAGGLLASGVDPTGYGGCASRVWRSAKLSAYYIEAGFIPQEVIQIMTLNGAKVLGD